MRKIDLLIGYKNLTFNSVILQQFKTMLKYDNGDRWEAIQSLISLYSFIYSTLITIEIMLLTVNSGFGFVIFVSSIKNSFAYGTYFVEAFFFSFVCFVVSIVGVMKCKMDVIKIIHKNKSGMNDVYNAYRSRLVIIVLFSGLSIFISLALFTLGFYKIKSIHEVLSV